MKDVECYIGVYLSVCVWYCLTVVKVPGECPHVQTAGVLARPKTITGDYLLTDNILPVLYGF